MLGARLDRWLRNTDRWWRNLPLRNRLTVAASLAAALAIVAVVSVAYVAVRHELRGQLDSQLRHQQKETDENLRGQAQQQIFNPFASSGFTISPGVGDIGGYAQLVSAQGEALPGSSALPITAGVRHIAANGGRMLRDGTFDGRHVRILTTSLPVVSGYALQIAVPLTAVDHQLHELAAAFLILALGGVALTALTSWIAVRRVTRPVRTLTETAERIADTRDLTLRINAESEDEIGRLATTFNTMLDALERSLTAQRQLVTDASHELRTPLASLRTNVEVLNDVERLTVPQRRAVLDGIVTQLDELTGLVADVVELARGEAPPSTHEEIALEDLLGRAVERAARHWPNVHFRLATEPVVVLGVANRLDRAIANLLDNAGKFSPPGGSVGVTLTSDGMITVADEGPGIPTEALPFVFDRFYRADEARALPGSGLGLAIAQQVAEGHGGRVRLVNGRDGGVVATLTLPAMAEPVPVKAAGVAAEPRPEPDVPIPVEESLFH